ncbi:MAG: hypothetical protein DI601_09445 [Azospirillum brasilense]|nr:MAG: hypothetical protein DI601_09445 [Azospirillum brasilense]
MIVSARKPARDNAGLGHIFVATDATNLLLRQMNELLEHGYDADYCLIFSILGEPRCGKTALIRAFDQASDARKDDFKPRKILEVQVPENPTVMTIATAMLHALGDGAPAHGTSYAKTSRAMTLLERGQYDVVIYDEIHRVVNGRTERNGETAASWISDTLNRRICPAIGIGEPSFAPLLEHKSYLDGRGMGIGWVKRCDWKNADSRLAFRTMLQGIGRGLGIPTDFVIEKSAVSEMLWKYSEGRIGFVSILLTKARILAARENAPALSMRHLHHAADELALQSTSKGTNPFPAPDKAPLR